MNAKKLEKMRRRINVKSLTKTGLLPPTCGNKVCPCEPVRLDVRDDLLSTLRGAVA